jgi:hypothetical protein
MDPASIAGLTGACIAIARNAVGFISGVSDIRARYRDAGLNIENINRQTEVLRLAADRLQTWLDRRGIGLSEDDGHIIRDSIQACRMLIQMLRDEADLTLRRGTNERERGKISRWNKVKFLWGQPRLDQYLVGINNQIAVINLFLQTLNLYVSPFQLLFYARGQMLIYFKAQCNCSPERVPDQCE